MAAIYYSPPLSRQVRLLLYLIGMAVIVIPASYGLARAYYGYTRYGPVAASAWGLPWMGLTGLFVLAWLLLFLLLLRRSRFGVLVYENGLRLGSIETPLRRSPALLPPLIPWETVTGVAVDMVASPQGGRSLNQVKLHLKDGGTIHLLEARSDWDSLAGLFGPPRIDNLPELITRLKAHLYPRLLPELRRKYLAGEPVVFGPVAVQTRGIVLGGHSRKMIYWQDIRRVTIRSGALVVELENSKKRSHIAYFPVFEIPNLELLLKLIEAYSC